jgi:hypothetical protein
MPSGLQCDLALNVCHAHSIARRFVREAITEPAFSRRKVEAVVMRAGVQKLDIEVYNALLESVSLLGDAASELAVKDASLRHMNDTNKESTSLMLTARQRGMQSRLPLHIGTAQALARDNCTPARGVTDQP